MNQLPRILMAFCLFLTCSVLRTQPLHEYFFNNNLNGTAGGPTLSQSLACGATNGSFGIQTITTNAGPCVVDTAFCFNDGGGISYANPSYITNQYTINVFFKFNTIGGWSRIIDFSNSTADAGIYWLTDCLNFYPNGNVGPCPYFVANLYYLLTFVRNGATGVISVYVNGALFGTYNDSVTNLYRCATNTTPIVFFRDDNVVQCEAQPGCVKYISITSAALTAAQVFNIWTNICTIILPVELVEFKSACKTNNVQNLSWTTSSENNNNQFIIDKSADGINWIELGRVTGAGNSNQLMHYEMQDEHAYATTYYRLKQIDFNGEYKYFDMIVANGCNELTEKEYFTIYPNPANGEININASFNGFIELYSSVGEKVADYRVSIGLNKISLSYYKAGAYYLRSITHVEKIVIQD
jgi:hypothetical protein